MNILEALAELSARNVDTVMHCQGQEWSMDNLIASINESVADESFEASSDAGDWAVDGGGIEQLNAEGYRNGNRYNVA